MSTATRLALVRVAGHLALAITIVLSSGPPGFSQQLLSSERDTASGSCIGTDTPPTLDFGYIPFGQTSSQQGYWLCVCGTCASPSTPYTVTGVSVAGTNPGDFPISTNTCNGFQFTDPNCSDCGTGGDYCTVENVFGPQEYGALSATTNVQIAYQGSSWVAFSWDLQGTGKLIVQPSGDFSLSPPTSATDPGSASPPPPFQAAAAATQSVSWTNTLSYQVYSKILQRCFDTSGAPPQDSFSTIGTETLTRPYSGEGGQMAVTATAGSYSESIQGIGSPMIFGTTIPNCLISQELASLYSGPTPTLMEDIAWQESTYQQFAKQNQQCYTIALGLLPKLNVNPSGQVIGTNVGLMQVGTSYDDAWNWVTNVKHGVNLFQLKYSAAQKYVNSQLSNCPGLAPFSQNTQMEDEALSAYGGWLGPCGTPSNSQCGASGGYYWQPALVSGQWQWAQNTACTSPTSSVIKYVNGVRAQNPPSPICP